MKSSEKISILSQKFELLKDTYVKEDSDTHDVFNSIVDNIIVPLLSIDSELACNMWHYMLKKYINCTFPVDYHKLTDLVIDKSNTEDLIFVFKNHSEIVQYVFENDPYESHLYAEWFIRDLVLLEEYNLANQLIICLLKNNNGENDPQKNLFETIHQIINSDESRWKMTLDGIDFCKKWILRVQNEAKRSQLEIAILSLTDIVEGKAPKGAMPFSMFASKGGVEALLREKNKDYSKIEKDPMDNNSKNTESKHTFNMQSTNEALSELDSLIGLDTVKAEVHNIVNYVKMRQIRQERNLTVPEMSLHLVFSGNPGTGKTTVARILGKIYAALGVLSKGHLIEVDRSGLVAGYVGQTAIKTQDVIQSALGGILFIDEAYSLAKESENDFGQEAIDTILKAMEDNREDFVVIVAGYDGLMETFINSNPGLKSRFNKYITFSDYCGEELYSIFNMFIAKNEYVIDSALDHSLQLYFNDLYVNRDDNFGNARDVRNIFEKIVTNQANRIVNIPNITNDDIQLICKDDLTNIIPEKFFVS